MSLMKAIEKQIFKNCLCGKPFYSKTSFYEHKKSCEHRKNKTVFKTCDCGKPLYSRAMFFLHKKCCEHHKNKTVIKTCDCGKSFYSRSSFYAHKKCCEHCKHKTVFKTCDCGKSFYSRTRFFAHKKYCKDYTKKEQSHERALFKICTCEKPFYNKTSYYRHIKCCIENKNLISPKENFKCQEENCQFSCSKRLIFLEHLKTYHSVDSCWEDITFQTYEEFEFWKEQFEKSTKAFFKVSHVKKSLRGFSKYFVCNRSGTYISQSTGKRAMKSQGLCQIGFNCPACIKVQIEEKSLVVKATLCNLHYGHENKLAYMRIPKNDRSLIANQLAIGIEPSHIRRSLFLTFPTELQRQHLVTRKDFENIAKAHGINKIRKHSEDHLSGDAYVEESLLEEKSIFIYKRQGENSLHYPKEEQYTLDKKDFALGIATEFQRQMLKKFGNNIVCLDATHGTNLCDFKLITVLVVDEFKEVIPVAWLINNSETYNALKLFFHLLKKQVGNVSPKILMCLKAPEYYKSWIDVFEGMPKKLLCHWHVHHDWQENITKIKNKDAASSLYKELCILIEETNKEKFDDLLHKCVKYMYEKEHFHEFAHYFQIEWLNIKEQWAKCHRSGAVINADMYLESFRKSIKHGESYLKEGKQGRLIDKCLYMLLDLAKDLSVKRLMKLEENKCTWKSTEIKKQHRASLNLPLSLVEQITEKTWLVKSEKSLLLDTTYAEHVVYVTNKQSDCTKNCQIKCLDCNICLHLYTCNCPDAVLTATICKHVHLVIRFLNTINDNVSSVDCVNQIENDASKNHFKYQYEDAASNISINLNIDNPITDVNVSNTDCINQIENDASKNHFEYENELAVSNIIDLNIDNPINEDVNNKESKCQNVDENYISSQFTTNVSSNLKSNFLAKIMALYDFAKQCDNNDLLLSAREHINSATSILKSSTNAQLANVWQVKILKQIQQTNTAHSNKYSKQIHQL